MTDWQAIIERATYTRFSKTGSLEPFLLARADLLALARQVSGIPGLALPDGCACQIRVPVESIGQAVIVLVGEWTG